MNISKEVPEYFLCPISQEIMTDPVVDNEGNTYNRVSIEKWLTTHQTSPLTRNFLIKEHLNPNRAIKDVIQTWIKESNTKIPSVILDYKKPLEYPKTELSFEVQNPQTIKVNSPENNGSGINVVFVIDTSGSMGADASDADEKGERDGLSILDVVTFSMNTIINTLGENDQVAAVSFSYEGKNVFGPTKITPASKQLVMSKLTNLEPTGQTNIWGGLFLGLEHAKKMAKNGNNRNTFVLLLTDGIPNISPPRGEQHMLNRFMNNPNTPPGISIQTYGFGYNIDVPLLKNLGNFHLVSDSGMVGTIYVNSAATMRACVATGMKMTLSSMTEFIPTPVLPKDKYELKNHGCTLVMDLGIVLCGQDRHISFQDNLPKDLTIDTVWYECGIERKSCLNNITQGSTKDEDNIISRKYLIHLFNILNNSITTENKIKEIDNFIRKNAKKFTPAFLFDLKGEIVMAQNSEKNYNRWGKPYLEMFLNSHVNQICVNFKDKSIQHYGGKTWNEERDRADDIFVTMPPPKPSNISSYGNYPGVSYGFRNVDMSNYNNVAGPCFSLDTYIQLEGGSVTQLFNIKKGSRVTTTKGNAATVICVVFSKTSQKLVKCSVGAEVTEWHPVKITNNWEFPGNNNNFKPTNNNKNKNNVINLILSEGNIVNLGLNNDVQAVTLGHGIIDNEVTNHPYYASTNVVFDLIKFKNFKKGEVYVNNVERNEETGLVSKLLE